MSAPTLPDGSERIQPIPCEWRAALARDVLSINDPHMSEIEIRALP